MVRMAGFVLVGMAVCGVAHGVLPGVEPDINLRRGDTNSDDVVDGSDPIYLSNYLNYSGPAPSCMNHADTNGDGQVDNADVMYLLDWLYDGGPEPASPGPFNDTCVSVDPYVGCEVDPCAN